VVDDICNGVYRGGWVLTGDFHIRQIWQKESTILDVAMLNFGNVHSWSNGQIG